MIRQQKFIIITPFLLLNSLFRRYPHIDHGCYYHECFLRGHPRLTVLMRRLNGGKGKSTPNQHSEPDFYKIHKTHPLQEAVDDKPVFSPVFDTKAENNSDPFPVAVAGSHNSDSFATTSDTAPVSLFETSIDKYVASGSKHHVGKTEQKFNQPESQHHGAFIHNYLGGGSLYDQSTNNGKINIQNQSQIRAQPQSATASACVGAEDGICRHGAPECSQQYAAAAAARVPRQEVAFAAYGYGYSHPSKPQSYFHDPLMAYQNLYQQESNYGQGQGGAFRYTPVVPNSRPRNNMRSSDAWIANTTATDDSLLSQPMSIPENGFDFNVTSLEDSFRTSAIDPPQEKKKND